MKKLTAAGGVLFREGDDGPEVLLIYRRGVWDLPKGKLEKGESVEECARREVAEEVGCELPEILADLPDTWHEYTQKGTDYGKTTHWFVMQSEANGSLEPQKSEGIEKVEWVGAEVAVEKVGYENLMDVLKSFLAWYASQ